MITFAALDTAGVAESIPWPWYAGAVAIGAGVIAWVIKLAFRPLLQAQTGQWIPRATVDLMIKAKDDEIARRNADLQSQREESVRAIAVIREEHNADIAAVRADHVRETEGTRRDSADWRTAYHLAAEVGKVQAAQLDELVEGYRLILSLIQALPKVESNSAEVNDRAGRGTPGRR